MSAGDLYSAAFERFAARLETAMAAPADPLHRSRNAGQAYVAFALAEPHGKALRIGDDVGFSQAVRSVLARPRGGAAKR